MNDIDAIRRQLSTLSFNDYLRHLKTVEDASQGLTPLRVAVLRSYTVEQIEPVLRLRLLLDGYQPTFWFGGYNQYTQEVLDPQSALYAFGPDLVLLMVRLEEVMPEFIEDAPSRSSAEWRQQIVAKA